MNTVFIAKEAHTLHQNIVGVVHARNILQAQSAFINTLSTNVLEKGIIIVDTGLSLDSPEAKLLFAIFGDDES